MSTTIIKPWVESVILHPAVLSPSFSEDIFALDLGPLADGNKNVPAVYRAPEQFFRASYLTNGLKSLLRRPPPARLPRSRRSRRSGRLNIRRLPDPCGAGILPAPPAAPNPACMEQS